MLRFTTMKTTMKLLSTLSVVILGLSSLASAQAQFAVDAGVSSVLESREGLKIQVKTSTYEIETPTEAIERASFESLSSEEKSTFLKNRAQFLQQAAKALQMLRYGFGIGSLGKEKIQYAIRNFKDDRVMNQIKELAPEIKDDAYAAREKRLEERLMETERIAQITFQDRSEAVIQSFLSAIDKNLWRQALLFTHSNEFGVMASAGLELLGGVQGKGGWGGLFDIGISLGYNRDTKSVVIQIFRDFERFKSTSMKAVFVTGALVKAGMYIANQRPQEMQRLGTSFYPPMAPGFSSSTLSTFQTGFSSGLTWPPSPLGDVMTYTNTLDSKVMLRISVSPMLKGFVRVQLGFDRSSLSFAIMPVLKAVDYIRSQFFGAASCRGLFGH